jgi:imidazolonepropionase-like amidohydrolase
MALVGFQSATNQLRDLTRGPATLVIKNVTLVDSRTGVKEPGVTIVVSGDRIVSIGARPDPLPSDVRVLDGTGKWVIPGFVDAHVHDASEDYLRDMLAWGVTAIHLMPNVPPDKPIEMESLSEMAQTSTPRIQLTEMFAGEFPDNLFPGVYQFIKPQTVDEARQSVRESNARGYRQIKIIRDDSVQWSGEAHRVPIIPQPVYEAMVREAHELGMRVYVHATQRDISRAAFATGVDAFMHGVMDVELAANDWQKMATARIVWTPSTNALHCFGDQRSYARRVLADERFVALLEESERASWTGMAESEGAIIPPPTAFLVENTEMYIATLDKNTRHALDAGIPIAVGTDGGPAGVSTHLEMEFLQTGGLTPSEVLTAATHGGAVALGRQADMGSVEVGKLADMVVLNGDPTADVRNSREIEWVIKGGVDYRPRQLALGH